MSEEQDSFPFIDYKAQNFSEEEMRQRLQDLYEYMNQRRSVRDFSSRSVPRDLIENIIRISGTAPSGAHKQPWSFCLVSNSEIKSKIRELAEEEEKISYGGRMSAEWLRDLAPLGTNWEKPFLEIAPWLIIVFKKSYDVGDKGEKKLNYYVGESIGIAVGFLLAAIHHAGLVALTHTPSPMNFLTKALERPENEKPYLLIPVGYPASDATVPDISRKPLSDIISYFE